tara:strand:- start:6 stop:959 length:954 start_codon:yes stop_codon:yes gene_type:complete
VKILLTGCAGFIGYHLTKKLILNDYEVLGLDNINDYYSQELKLDRLDRLHSLKNFKYKKTDISDKHSLERVFKNFKPNKVVNLAAQPGVRYSLINPHAYANSNLVGFINIIEQSRMFDVDGFIYASSSSVYGNNVSYPFAEKDRVDEPISLYGATKRSNELIAHSYSHLYNLNTTGLRFFTVYGPWYRPDMAMHIFANKMSKNEPIEVFNKGNMKRDFTYIDDIVDGTFSAIEHNYECEIFNLGNNKAENLMDIINILEESLGMKAKINFKPMQPGDVKETYANIDLSKNKLEFSPSTNIKNGILEFSKWFKEYYNV